MEKEFNTENIVHVIEDWTEKRVMELGKEQEELLKNQLIPRLKKELAVQEMQARELERMQAEHELRNLAAKFVLSIKGGFFEDALSCFALDTPEVWANVEKYGIYEGKKQLEAYFVDYFKRIGGGEGCFILYELMNPVIELSGDGESAKAMFNVQGILAVDTNQWMSEHDVARSVWQYAPWYMEFKKEAGQWKIWHLTMYDEIETFYETSWSELNSRDELRDPSAPVPGRSNGENHGFSNTRAPYLHMEPPMPYVSLDEAENGKKTGGV